MITVNDNDVKITPKKRTIKVKNCFINETGSGLILTDEDGTNILDEIKNSLPEDVDTFSFNISFELSND